MLRVWQDPPHPGRRRGAYGSPGLEPAPDLTAHTLALGAALELNERLSRSTKNGLELAADSYASIRARGRVSRASRGCSRARPSFLLHVA